MRLPTLVVVLLWAVGCRSAQPSAARLDPLERAQVHLAGGKPGLAVGPLEELLRERPTDATVARTLAEAYVKAGRAADQIARLTASPERDPAIRHFLLGLLYFADPVTANGPALDELRQAVGLRSAEPEFHFRLGVALLELERYEQALASLGKATELAPSRASYRLPLAKALHRTGRNAEAVAALAEFVDAAPSPAEVRLARALMDELSDPFNQLPQAARASLEQGLTWLHTRDSPQQAIVTFEELLQSWPDLAIVHALLGLAYQRLDDAGRAIDEYRRAIELAPADGKNHLYLGELYLARQRPRQAEDSFRLAVRLNPLLPQAHLRLGELELERGNLNQARDQFARTVLLEPTHLAAAVKLALAHQLAGDWKAAEVTLDHALVQAPSSVELKLRLGLLHAEHSTKATAPDVRQRAAAEASRWLREVLREQPDNAIASRALETVQSVK